MSNEVNTNLLERAYYWSEEYANTTLGDIIDMMIACHDMEALAVKVKEAEDYHKAIDLVNDSVRTI